MHTKGSWAIACVQRSPAAIRKLSRFNKQDVQLFESIFNFNNPDAMICKNHSLQYFFVKEGEYGEKCHGIQKYTLSFSTNMKLIIYINPGYAWSNVKDRYWIIFFCHSNYISMYFALPTTPTFPSGGASSYAARDESKNVMQRKVFPSEGSFCSGGTPVQRWS